MSTSELSPNPGLQKSAREAFLSELLDSISSETQLERVNRRYTISVNWLIWFSHLMLLSLSTYGLSNYGKSPTELWLLLMIAIFSVLNVSLPGAHSLFKFQQRQEVHEGNVRALSVLKTECVSGLVQLEDALQKYKKIVQRSVERDVRRGTI